MQKKRPEEKKNMRQDGGRPVFSVYDEIKRNRRIALNKRIRHVRELRQKILAVALSLFVVFGTVIAVVCLVTRTHNITVSGNSRYTDDEIISAAGIDGDILPLLTDNSVYKKIVSDCPYINEIKLKKTYPSSVEIIVNETEVVYYLDVRGDTYTLDRDLRVIEVAKNTDGLVYLKLPEVVEAIIGNKIVFADEKDAERVPKIISELLGENLLPFTSVDLSNRFSIVAMIGKDIKIDFGNYNDLNHKMATACNLVGKVKEQQLVRAFINVSNYNNGSITPNF